MSENQAAETPSDEGQPKTSSALDFKKQREDRAKPKAVKLPSGLVAQIIRPSLKKLISDGHVPSNLAAQVVRPQDQEQDRGFGKKELEDNLKIQEIIVKHALVIPKVVDKDPNYDKGEIVLDDLDEADQGFITQQVMGEGARPDAVTSFRGKQ